MPEPRFCETVWPVRWRDADPNSLCRPSALLDFFQECALDAPDRLGLTPEALSRRYGAFWMLTRVRYRLTAPVRWRETLTLRTWHCPPKGMVLRREFQILRDGETIGGADALWGLADLGTRRLIDLGRVPELNRAPGGRAPSAPLRPLPPAEGLLPAGDFSVPVSQADRNGHFNNARCADLVCDCVPPALWDGTRFPAELQIDYRAESRPGDRLRLLRDEGRGDVFRMRGLGEDGTPRFDAMLAFAKG